MWAIQQGGGRGKESGREGRRKRYDQRLAVFMSNQGVAEVMRNCGMGNLVSSQHRRVKEGKERGSQRIWHWDN